MKIHKSISGFLLFFVGVLLTGDNYFSLPQIQRTPASLTVDDVDLLYAELKSSFEASPHCNPAFVLNNPEDRLNPILVTGIWKELDFMTVADRPHYTREWRLSCFDTFAKKWQLSDDLIEYAKDRLATQEERGPVRFDTLTRVRGMALQEATKLAQTNADYMVEFITNRLVQEVIYTEDEEGNAICPFVQEDAFKKAMQGRAKILKAALTGVKNPNILTILDYSRPSNERRLYVFDLKEKRVLHNTWSAHGGGPTAETRQAEQAGKDGYGSSPTMKNDLGKLYSSEGFMLGAGVNATWGTKYGPNVQVNGIDLNNTNLLRRAVVVHGWRTPYSNYLSGDWQWDWTNNRRKKPLDTAKKFLELDFKSESLEVLEEAASSYHSLVKHVIPLDPTDGCLGVPDTKQMGHVDVKGRNKTQLELLMDDLPGTIMFNYSGPGQKSKWY